MGQGFFDPLEVSLSLGGSRRDRLFGGMGQKGRGQRVAEVLEKDGTTRGAADGRRITRRSRRRVRLIPRGYAGDPLFLSNSTNDIIIFDAMLGFLDVGFKSPEAPSDGETERTGTIPRLLIIAIVAIDGLGL